MADINKFQNKHNVVINILLITSGGLGKACHILGKDWLQNMDYIISSIEHLTNDAELLSNVLGVEPLISEQEREVRRTNSHQE